ncbi:MAG: ice-binding family protein, partial [Chitinophagales bacterium]|nr:ice-binding family protein [Chitinophagales bacterium]
VDAGADLIACTGTRVQLGGSPTIAGGRPPYTVEWSPPLYMDSVYFHNPIVTVHHNITYTITVTDADDVRVTDSVKITARSRPQAIAGHDRLVSPNSPTVLGGTTTGGTPPYTFLWQPALYLNQTNAEKPTATPLANITYSLTVTDANGCIGNDQVTVRLALPSLGAAGLFALLAGDSLVAASPVQVAAKAGSRKFISATITSSDTIVIKSPLDSLAIAAVDGAIQYIKNLNATTLGNTLDGQSLQSGVYQINGKATLNGTLTLQGDEQSVFLFNLKDSLVVGNGAAIVLNGVNRNNVLIRVAKGMRISGTAQLPAIFLVEKSITGGTVHQATLWSLVRIRIQAGSFAAPVAEARLSSFSRSDAADWFGVNSSNIERVSGIYRSHWSDLALRRTLPLLNLRLFRYPPGGDAKVWNGNDGWFFHADEKSDNTALSFGAGMNCVRTTFTFDKEAANLPANRWLEFKHILTGNDAKGMYVVNLFTRPEFQRDILQHAVDLNVPLQFVELGNEFYLRGQTCGFLHAADYAAAVNQFISLVRSSPSLQHLRFGIVGSAFNYETNLNNENGCRRFTWNAELLPLLSNLQPGDALTFHLYPSTGLPASQAPNVSISDVPALMRRAYDVTKTFAENELAALANYPHLEAWITEYNLTDPSFKIHGSWSHGLFLALFTLRLLEMDRVKRVTCQTMANDAGRGLLFIDQYGFFIPDDWQTIDSTLLTQPWGLTAGGMAIKQLTDAMRYSTKATLLRFENSPLLAGSSYPALYGWTFDKSLGDKQSVLLNLSPQSQWVNVATLAPYSAMEQIYCTNPLYFFTGYVYRDQPTPGVYNAVEYNYQTGQITPVNYDSLHVRLPAGTTEILLPPYSITRLYVINSSGVWLRQSGTSVCAADPLGTVPSQASTAVNFYASGGARYTWSFAETNARQQNNISASPATALSNGMLSVYDPEGTLLGQTSTLSVSTVALPSVTVTPTFFDNAVSKTSSFTAVASGALTYNWNPTYGLNAILGNSVTLTPRQSRRYFVIGAGSTGCARQALIQTTVHPQVTIRPFGGSLRSDLYPPILSVCQGQTITLVADGAADRYRWFTADGSINTEAPSLTLTPADNLLITLEATDQTLPATSRTSLWIRVYPTVSIEQDDLFG